MRASNRVIVFLLLLLVPVGAGVRANGTVDSTGATLTPGVAPTQGAVTVLPCVMGGAAPAIPPLGSLGAIGTMTGSLPPFPGGGSGSDGAFHATSDQTLPGGTFNFTTYAVDAGVTVTYSGAVTIRTTGDVTVSGTVQTTSASASITLRCAGTVNIAGGVALFANIRTTGAGGAIDIAAARDFLGGINATVRASKGDVTIVADGTAPGLGRVALDGTSVLADAGNATVQGLSLAFTNEGYVECTSGRSLLQAFGGDVSLDTSSYADDGAAAPLTVEASGSVSLKSAAYFDCGDSDITVTAFGGDVTLDAAYFDTGDAGAVTVRASGAVKLSNHSYFDSESGAVTVTAFGGDVTLDQPNPGGTSYIDSGAGAVSVSASGGVALNGFAYIDTGNTPITVRALGGDAAFTGQAYVSSEGAVDIRAGHAVTAVPDSQRDIYFDGSSVSLSSGAGGMSLDLDQPSADGGPFTVLSLGPITLAGTYTAAGALTVVSCGGTVDISAATLRTKDQTAPTSGDIVVETYAPVAQTIDAHGASIKSGAAAATSGSIALRVHVATKAIESFFLPTRVGVKPNAKTPAKSSLLAVGFFDTGPNPADFTESATLHVSGLTVDIPAFTAAANGKRFTYKSGSTLFNVWLNPTRSSRAKFGLRYKGDFTGEVDPAGTLDLRLVNAALDGDGAVKLTAGRYKIGLVRGALVAPNLYPKGVRASVPGKHKDKLVLAAGLASGGTTPASASDLTIGLGDTFTATIPAASFTRQGDAYVSRGGVAGITSVRIDYAREKITVKGTAMDLGTFAAGDQSVLLSVQLGTDGRAVRVRMVRNGNSIKY